MTKATKTRPTVLASSTSSIQEANESIGTSETGVGSGSDAVDVSLDVTSIVLTTLRDASNIPPVPFLSDAAGIAVNIAGVVQKARSNKGGFKRLGEESCELVYVIVRANQDVLSVEEVPGNLTENLQHLVNALTSAQKFAQKGASRNFFKAMLCSNADSGRIKDHREKLKQFMRVFGLQPDISLHETVAKLASQQVEMKKEIERRKTPDPSRSTSPSTIPPPRTPDSQIPTRGPVKVTSAAEDVVPNKTPGKTMTNMNSHNAATNSTLNTGNNTVATKLVTNKGRS